MVHITKAWLMNDYQLKKLLKKYDSGTCDEVEVEMLHEFFDLHSKSELDQKIKNNIHYQSIKEEIYSRLQIKIRSAEKFKSNTLALFIKVAASFILLATTAYVVYKYSFEAQIPNDHSKIVKATQNGQKLTVRLPDGTVVQLNSDSELTYPEQFGETREVNLQGEAFFDVVSNKTHPFIVTTGEIKTRVLGTSFNINAYPESDQVEISLISGAVQVLTSKDSIGILPSEQAIYTTSSKKLIARKADLSNYLAWKEGVLIFDGNTLSEITRELVRWYGTPIKFENPQTKACDLHLSFDNLSLTEVLDQLVLVSGIKYEFLENGEILMSGIGCINK